MNLFGEKKKRSKLRFVENGMAEALTVVGWKPHWKKSTEKITAKKKPESFTISLQWVASDKTHCEPFDLSIPEQWVFG
jgi:hypothetical protein